ncbi:MAG TPA: rhomboid family intramembrane serine protease [Steroidobacteraceae bacterium]|jgi:membrane associated rhomboid family serine protease|nr:rhomboid family intramembrane serine protease [Steroidobacteraceae bacterium]
MNFDRTPAALSILGLIVVISALGLMHAPGIIERNLLRPYYLLRDRAYSTLITCGFVHKDFGHLFFNGLTLYFFGPGLEWRIGTGRFIALYFIGLVVSSLGTVYKQRNNPEYRSLGASGAILAVLFAYIVYYPTNVIYLYFALPIPAVLFAFGYLGYTWWASRNARDGINHDAHLDGAITGLVFVGVTDNEVWVRAFRTVGDMLS